MPRVARIVLPGYPHHVIQRGHNRAPVFAREKDCNFYLSTLKEWKSRLGCKVFAYCLMTNHVHLVIDPGEDATNLGHLMKRLAARYTRYINRVEQRSGTAWNGRYKSSPIDTDSYLMACCRYVELNPVRAGIVGAPARYRWSSYTHRYDPSIDPWLDEHSLFATLGATPAERARRYRDWVSASIPNEELKLIREAAQRGQITGDSWFVQTLEQRVGHRLPTQGRGRPRK